MKQKLFNKKKYAPECSSCFHGRMTADGESVLCVKNGIMMPDHKCGSYRYDPLKRKPKRQRNLGQFSPEDFKL